MAAILASMLRMLSRWLGVLALALAAAAPAAAQADSVRLLAQQLARYQARGPLEKLFLHLDRPVYVCGETMWLALYAADGTSGKPLAFSSIAYVEVLDARNRPVLQGKVALKNARGQGSFVLPASLASGTYAVRAYTSWMRNDGPDGFFQTSVTILNTAVASGARPSADSTAFDARFFPEGGNLVQGLPSKVAFKVTGRGGLGLAATGRVLGPGGQVVATLRTLHQGMGSFTFTPAAGAAYTAVLTLGSGRTLTRPLPAAYAQGYVMHLDDSSPDYLVVEVAANSPGPQTVFLLSHARQRTLAALEAPLVNGRAVFSIKKRLLLPGVTRFTVFDGRQRPVCERLYFQRPTQPLALRVQADKPAYSSRSQVNLEVSAAGLASEAASLSVAVYRLDSLNPAPALAIDHYLWLTSELRGVVEQPAYYFTATGPEAAEATHNLLLTQGWRRFRWDDVLAPTPPAPAYPPEANGPLIRAQLTPAGPGQPRAGVLAYLSSPSRLVRLTNGLSDAQGRVAFDARELAGTRDIIIQTDPQQDSTSRITLLSPFAEQYARGASPPFGLLPRLAPAYAKRHFQSQVMSTYFAGESARSPAAAPADSLAFYGPPSEQYFLDKYTRFQVLEEVLREYVPGVLVKIRKDGYHLMVVDQTVKNTLNILKDNPLVLLDGVPLFSINKLMAISPLKFQRLEVMDSRYLQGLAIYNGIVSFSTYRGDLAGIQLDPRALVQQYEGVQAQREFYAPRYDTPLAAQSRLPDLRNLLYWNPAVATQGTAPQHLSFYTGDQAGRYRVVVQGLAAGGQCASTSYTLEVKPVL